MESVDLRSFSDRRKKGMEDKSVKKFGKHSRLRDLAEIAQKKLHLVLMLTDYKSFIQLAHDLNVFRRMLLTRSHKV